MLLFQRSPLVQILFPEARVLSSAGIGEITKWSVAVVAGLGAFDTVSGASTVTQLTPTPKSATVTASVDSPLSFTFQYGGSDTPDHFQIVGALPTGLTQAHTRGAKTDTLSGIPTTAGNYPITIKAWRNASQSSNSVSANFTINVGDGVPVTLPVIFTQPQPVSIKAGKRAILKVSASGPPLTYQWFKGASGVTTRPIAGAQSATFRTPVLRATQRFWVRVTNSAGSAKSGTVVVTVR